MHQFAPECTIAGDRLNCGNRLSKSPDRQRNPLTPAEFALILLEEPVLHALRADLDLSWWHKRARSIVRRL